MTLEMTLLQSGCSRKTVCVKLREAETHSDDRRSERPRSLARSRGRSEEEPFPLGLHVDRA